MLSKYYIYENEDQINLDLKCTICLEPFQSPFSSADCHHTFCFQCLTRWLQQKQTCPICRRYFSEFTRMIDQKRRNELDDLFVQCLQCNERNIRRGQFNKHLACNCSKQLRFDEDIDEETLLGHLNSEYLIKINEIEENYRRYYRNYHRSYMDSLPIWVVLLSSTHLIIYLSILIPLAILFYLIDILICPILHGISFLLHFIRIRI